MAGPLIGITTSRRGGWRSYLMHRLALARAGLRAIRLVSGAPPPGEPLAGLVIGGGDDIGAEIYGGRVLPDVRIDPERDRLELRLLEAALPARLPVLGIDLSKQQQLSDWGADTLTEAQLTYAASDVLHLHALREKLDSILAREGRADLAAACFRFLPDRVRLDVAGWAAEDLFAHS